MLTDFLITSHDHLPLIGLTWTELWDVTDGEGYQFWSGFAGSFVFSLGITSGITLFWHKHNCHEHRCLRLSWHPDEDGYPVCKVHHDDHPRRPFLQEVKHFLRTGHLGDHDHPRHRRNRSAN